MKMRVYSWGCTDVGLKRDHNEDSYLLAPDLHLFVVADGMGGHAGGEMASGISVRTVDSHVREHKDLVDPDKDHEGEIQNSPVAKLLSDGNLLLTELDRRRQAIHDLLTGTQPKGGSVETT